MTAQERVQSLVERWVASKKAGTPISLAELCREYPHLLPDLLTAIERLAHEARLRLEATAPDATHPSGEPSGEGTQLQAGPPFVGPTRGNDYPTELGGYKLTQVLGEGGMGRVYLADDPKLSRQIAVKVMRPEVATNPLNRERFLREARAIAQLQHEHIVPIFLVGEEGEVPFLVMPLLQGESLDARLKRAGKLSLKESLRIGREIAEGLQAAHERGLIHRDIKPANVWLDGPKGRVKILDFGLAKVATGEGGALTQSGAVMGTPAYMAPEQARGQAVDFRADLFSLGCIIYQMLTGRRPFPGTDTMSILTSLAIDTPPTPHSFDPLCPREISDLTMQLLAKSPDQRPVSALEVVETLSRFELGLSATTRVVVTPDPWANIKDDSTEVSPPSVPPRDTATSRRFRVALVGVLALALIGWVIWQVVSRPGAEQGTPVVKGPKEDEGKGKDMAVSPIIGAEPNGGGDQPQPPQPGPNKAEEIPRPFRLPREPLREVAAFAERKNPKGETLPAGNHVTFSPDGKYIAACGFGFGGVKVYESRTLDQDQVIEFTSSADRATFSPEGDQLAVLGSGHLKIYGWPSKSAHPLRNETGFKESTGLTYSLDGRWLVWRKHERDRGANDLYWLDRKSPNSKPIIVMSGANQAHEIAFSPDSSVLAAVNHGNSVFLFDANNPEKPPESIHIEKAPPGMTLSTSAEWVAIAVNCEGQGRVELYSLPRGSTRRTLTMPSPGRVGPFLGGSRYLTWAGYNGSIYLVDVAEKKIIDSIKAHDTEIRGIAVAPDEILLATIDLNGRLKVWELRPQTATFSDRKAAEFVIDRGGMVTVADNASWIKNQRWLPTGPFRLTGVDLRGTQVTDNDLRVLRGCVRLSHLSLMDTGITNAGMVHLQDCKRLNRLDLKNTKVSDEGLAYLRGNTDLETLHLGMVKGTETEFFRGLKKLKEFWGRGNVNPVLAALKDSDQLQSLVLNDTKQLTGQGLAELRHFPNLKTLRIPMNDLIDDEALKALLQCPQLTMLQVGPKITDQGLKTLARLQSLKTLELQNCPVTPEGIAAFKAELPDCKVVFPSRKPME